MVVVTYEMDAADRELIRGLRTNGRATTTELARQTGMARATVQSRLARLERTKAILGWGPEVDERATGHAVTSFTTLSIAQGSLDAVVTGLDQIPEVLEVHVTTGGGDLLCHIIARSNDHLHELIQQIVAIKGVARTDSHLVLTTPIKRTVADLIAAQQAVG